MSEFEKAALALWREVSDAEIAGKVTESEALRLLDALEKIEAALKESE